MKDNVELNYKSQIPDITLQKMMLKIDEKIKYDQLLYFLNLIVEDTYRIKGFVKVEGVLYLVNCVGTMINVEPYYQGKEVNIGQIVVLSGEGLPLRKTIKNAISKYEGLFSIIK